MTTVASTLLKFARVADITSIVWATHTAQRLYSSGYIFGNTGGPHLLQSPYHIPLRPCFGYTARRFVHNPYRRGTIKSDSYALKRTFSRIQRASTEDAGAATYSGEDRAETFGTGQHNLTESKMPPTGAPRARFYFQVVTTPTSDTPGTTILLHFDHKRYLFGRIAEGTQRACIQRGVKLKSVREIFITGPSSWQNIGGLLGMILTMADVQNQEGNGDEPAEKPRLGIHGGALLTHALACGRRFIFRTGMPISVTEFEDFERASLEEPSWSDDNIQVWALPAYRSTMSLQARSEHADSDAEPFSDSSSASSGRKRKHDEFTESNALKSAIRLNANEQKIRRTVVSDMFESGWRHDKLVETPWAEVQQSTQMFIRDSETHALMPFKPSPTTKIPPNQKVLVREPWPAALLTDLPVPPKKFPQPAISYIVRGYPQRGHFDPKKASELGVPRGPLYKQLASGIPLTLENGKMVTPEMVLGPTKPGGGVAIIDLPHLDMLEHLLSRPEWKSEKIMHGVEAMFWVLGPGIAADPQIQSFMKSFPKVQHIISSSDLCPDYLAMDSSAASAIRLSRISRDHFPVPVHDNRTLPQRRSQGLTNNTVPDPDLGARAAERGIKIQVEPKFELQCDEIVPWLDTMQAIKIIPQKVHELAEAARREIRGTPASPNSQMGRRVSSPSFAKHEIITLGTGSASPSKYRNVSATLLRIPGKGSYLFDCGENTIGQLSRVFGPQELADVLLDLKLIWISHLHADHHLGTLGVLTALEMARDALPLEQRRGKEVFIASEEKMMSFLDDIKPLSPNMYVRYLICNPWRRATIHGNPANFHELGLPIKELATAAVKHCWGAQAVSITFDDHFKFSYSGDCRPSSYFAAIGRNSDVLVHEATFDDGMEGDAMAKKHSTTAEALAVASLMKAKNVILTHFSQRYQKIPVMGNVKLPQQVKFEDETPSEEAIDGPVDGPVNGPIDEGMDTDVLSRQIKDASVTEHSLENSVSSTTQSNSKDSVEQLAKLVNRTPQATQEHTGVAPKSGQGPPKTAGSSSPPNPTSASLNSLRSQPQHEMNICVAFDYMRVHVADIKHMGKFTPALTALFESEHPEIADVSTTEQERNAVINNTGRKPNPKTHPAQGNGQLHKAPQKDENSDMGLSGKGKGGLSENKDTRMEVRREKRKKSETAEKKKGPDGQGKAGAGMEAREEPAQLKAAG